MQIIKEAISREFLAQLATQTFGDMVKGVVDVRLRLLALGADLHADEEAALLDAGSKHEDLWGINLYPERTGDELIEYDSVINIRPSQGNRSRFVEDAVMRRRIAEFVLTLIE